MRDAGLEHAIKAAGGVGSLARALGIAQPSVSAWSRVPAERVLAIESITKVSRFTLRPDLYGAGRIAPESDETQAAPADLLIGQARVAEFPSHVSVQQPVKPVSIANHATRVIGLAGWSGAGKTTLLSRVIPLLGADGLRVSTIKHAHHKFDVDKPGKDSYVHREAGAVEVLVSSHNRWALMHELRGAPEPTLSELLAHMSPVDLVIVEGYKTDRHPKIEVHRLENGKDFLFPGDEAVIGIATDAKPRTSLPVVHIDDIAGIAALIRARAVSIGDLLAAEIAAG